ncbi:hypothetical protein chiPu_0029326, partial [Chiloscyllium punctatum]|nr:hypothetical protein [Chiloscyllium punctatum]
NSLARWLLLPLVPPLLLLQVLVTDIGWDLCSRLLGRCHVQDGGGHRPQALLLQACAAWASPRDRTACLSSPELGLPLGPLWLPEEGGARGKSPQQVYGQYHRLRGDTEVSLWSTVSARRGMVLNQAS